MKISNSVFYCPKFRSIIAAYCVKWLLKGGVRGGVERWNKDLKMVNSQKPLLSFLLGKVLVNCLMGMSRSSTCVLAYLMLRQNMTAVEALTEVRRHREVRPNDGFLRQLADLDNKLRRERGQLKLLSSGGACH